MSSGTSSNDLCAASTSVASGRRSESRSVAVHQPLRSPSPLVGTPNPQGGRGGTLVRDELIKTKICQNYKTGFCRYRECCIFAHGTEELRPVPKGLRPVPREHRGANTNSKKDMHHVAPKPIGDIYIAMECDSTMSAPVPQSLVSCHAGCGFPQATQGSLYKTQLCRNHLSEDGCRYGKACNFAHGEAELRLVRGNMLYHEVIPACDALKENARVARTVMNAEDVLGARLPVSNAPLPANTVADAPPAYPTTMNETGAASAPTTVLTEERVANAVPPATTVADAPPSPMKQSADASAPTTVVTARLLPCHASSVPLNLFRDVRPSTDCLRENLVVRTPLYGDLPLPRLVENAPHW